MFSHISILNYILNSDISHILCMQNFKVPEALQQIKQENTLYTDIHL